MSFPVPRPLSLRLVAPHEELSGVAPAVLERAAKTCQPGDPTHRGLIFVDLLMARHGLRACTPPSAHPPIVALLDGIEAWAHGQSDEHAVKKARAEAFAAMMAVETKTVSAVRASLEMLKRSKQTPLDGHADGVVLRYAGLGAYHACAAALLTADAISEPPKVALVAQQVAGAMAYQAAGLGPARSSEMRSTAWSQAEFEAERPGAPVGHQTGALAVQLFHEFLGSYWKDKSDAQRAFFGELVEWALGPLMS